MQESTIAAQVGEQKDRVSRVRALSYGSHQILVNLAKNCPFIFPQTGLAPAPRANRKEAVADIWQIFVFANFNQGFVILANASNKNNMYRITKNNVYLIGLNIHVTS